MLTKTCAARNGGEKQNTIRKGSTESAVSTVKLLSLVLKPCLFREKEQSGNLEQVDTSG